MYTDIQFYMHNFCTFQITINTMLLLWWNFLKNIADLRQFFKPKTHILRGFGSSRDHFKDFI